MSLKPICVRCQRFYRPEKNGFRFTEMMPRENSALPGTTEPSMWRPYKIWIGDKWKCHGCGHEIIVGVGWNPVRVQHEEDFDSIRVAGRFDQLQVNDC